jgi:8-oxo-dGTP diphosphatase
VDLESGATGPDAAASLPIERPLTTVDVAIFAVVDRRLCVLLVRRAPGPGEPFPGWWALPGGFVDVALDEDLEATALRKLREKTGVRAPYLEQLGSFGGRDRDPRGWSATHVWFALVNAAEVRLGSGGNADAVRWVGVRGDGVGEPLAFDHGRLLTAALRRLRAKVEYTALPVHLLPVEFTLAELQDIFELILGRELDRSSFRTRMLAAEFLDATRRQRGGANRPARLYRLRRECDVIYFPRPLMG